MHHDASTTTPGPHCLKCDYDLRGLGIPCICPECGTECDPIAFVVKFQPAVRCVHQIVGSALLLALLIWTSPSWKPNIVMIFLGASVAYSAFQISRLRRWSSKWYVNHGGIHLLDGAYHPQSIGWSHYGLARCSWLWQRLRIDDPNGQRVVSFPYRRIGTHKFACEIARRLNSAAALYEVKRREADLAGAAALTASRTNPRSP